MLNRRLTYIFIFGLISFMAVISGCRKDRLIDNPSAKLAFSQDTVIFDTLFTTVGSTTRQLKIYNRNRGKVNIDRIYLAGNAGNSYRMNVDGLPGTSFSDIEIDGGDSLYIFVEVTLNPNSLTTPLLVTDSIIFITNGNVQDVDLVAWGQDAYFHTPPNGATSPFFSLPCNSIWTNDKPHVIYGYPVVDSTCSLLIQPGTKIYSHPNSALVVYNGGTLNADGDPGNRIIFQGDRLEPNYDSLPGQWSGIILLEAGNSRIEHCDIRNASVGVRVQTISGTLSPLIMEYVRLENMSNFGVWNYVAGDISMTNCMINNCGQYAFICTGGGFVRINHCTFANYWNYTDRRVPAFGMANFFEDATGALVLVDLNAEVSNSIIYGNEGNEFAVNMNAGAVGNFVFNTCYIKSDQDLSNTTNFINVSQNVDPRFEEPNEQRYKLQSISPCINTGNLIFRIDYDLDFYTRDALPDIGCFEFQ